MPVGGSPGFSVRVQWPEPSRLIPEATRSVQVELSDAGGFRTYRVVNRPTSGTVSTIVFVGLAPGAVDYSATAFPEVDAQGVAVAAATGRVTLATGQRTDVRLDLASTIERIDIVPAEATVRVGATRSFAATARDADGDAVPTSTGRVSWSSSDPRVASVDAAGLVRGIAAGSTRIVFKDSESGRQESALLVVEP